MNPPKRKMPEGLTGSLFSPATIAGSPDKEYRTMDLTNDVNWMPYPSRRTVCYGSRGMVCASQPLAAQAGLDMIKQGGNAVDAIVAAAATLTVVEPTSNGLGSDAFAIIWKDGKLRGLNASGPIPKSVDMDLAAANAWITSEGKGSLPVLGWAPVTVPGAPAAWAELCASSGRLSLAKNLEPAISLARGGHAVAPTVAHYWKLAALRYALLPGDLRRAWFDAFAPGGQAPQAGELWKSEAQARTLERIADSNGRDFYHGLLAAELLQASASTGGYFHAADLGDFTPQWVDPISVRYHGFDVWELPPNGQGLAALQALAILDGMDLPGTSDAGNLSGREAPRTLHCQIEAMKLAFADAHRFIADPDFSSVPVDRLLAPDYVAARRSLIGFRAEDRKAGKPLPGGTVYLCAADGEGTMVSYIQSNYMGFGSGVVVPGTGISLNNRGHCFSLDPSHPNVLASGKRPYNTIIPGFLTKDGQAMGPFGVMGGFMQPQGHLQVLMNAIDFGLNPQQALDAPRWQWTEGLKVVLEPGFGPSVPLALRRLGHEAEYSLEAGSFGRGQIIWKTMHGTLAGATEPRADGCVAAW
jgi:gamma-glutamyltranspeptidase/glutathione hydrolase